MLFFYFIFYIFCLWYLWNETYVPVFYRINKIWYEFGCLWIKSLIRQDSKKGGTSWTIIISLEIFWTRIILLYAYHQVIYYNYVKFHQLRRCAYKTWTDRRTHWQGDSYNTPLKNIGYNKKQCLIHVYISLPVSTAMKLCDISTTSFMMKCVHILSDKPMNLPYSFPLSQCLVWRIRHEESKLRPPNIVPRPISEIGRKKYWGMNAKRFYLLLYSIVLRTLSLSSLKLL